MKTRWLTASFAYDGSQLRSLYAYMNWELAGDSLIAWRGPCEVKPEHMVDGEDRRAEAIIRGGDMVHFVIEKFDCSLLAAVGLQRLFATVVRDGLVGLAKNQEAATQLRRHGDDLFLEERKLSISIATVSPVSALIHFAVNVTNENTPVPTLSLHDLGVDPEPFGRWVLEQFGREVDSMIEATQKVFGVK